MIKAIRRAVQKLEGVTAVYGMGSYFRGEAFNDVDIVAVVRRSSDLVALGVAIRAVLQPLSAVAGRRIDITIFTESEFAANPLRDMETLVPIFPAKLTAA